MNSGKNTVLFLIGTMFILSIATMIVIADSDYPIGIRHLVNGSSSRANVSAYPPQEREAEAGNVTEINLSAVAITKTWQGYYGEITGEIVLENSNGDVFYNWTANEPKGEIYASTNNTISWGSIVCFNWTSSGQAFDLEGLEAEYGITDDSEDGVNETFNSTGLDTNFFVGSRNITEESTAVGHICHSTNTYQSGGQVPDEFENVLLTDNESIVFTTIIENNEVDTDADEVGFDGETHDFQLLVAENGHDGYEDETTTYYFWAELG